MVSPSRNPPFRGEAFLGRRRWADDGADDADHLCHPRPAGEATIGFATRDGVGGTRGASWRRGLGGDGGRHDDHHPSRPAQFFTTGTVNFASFFGTADRSNGSVVAGKFAVVFGR